MSGVRKSTAYVARITFGFTIQDFQAHVSDRLGDANKKLQSFIETSGKLIDHPDYEWRFGDVEVKDGYIYGRLGKIRRGKTKFVYDESKKGFKESESHETEAEIANFVISLKRHVMVFEERRPNIGYTEFIFSFTTGFSNYVKKRDALNITLITDKILVENIIKNARKIMTARFVIKPSNPDWDADSKKIDEELKAMKAQSGKLEVTNKDGLDFHKPTILRGAIAQSNMGYGHYTLTYEDSRGETMVFYSRQKVLKESVETKNQDEIQRRFKQILDNAIHLLDEHK